MRILMEDGEHLRVQQSHEKNNFLDIRPLRAGDGGGAGGYFGQEISLWPGFHYIEVRKKKSEIVVLLFKSRESVQYVNMERYEDYEVVYSCDEVMF